MVCQLVEMCDGYGGRCKEVWEGVIVVRKCDSPQEVCQLFGRCDGHGEKKGGLGRCNS